MAEKCTFNGTVKLVAGKQVIINKFEHAKQMKLEWSWETSCH